MINSEQLCMSCMKEIGDEQQCPHCGYYVDTPQIQPYLAVRTVVGNRYLIGKLLEYNGDGATYIGWDINERKPVTIREFLPDALCNRQQGSKEVTVMFGCEMAYSDCLADFVELWRKLTRMSGLSALENVYEVFEENSTAYAISEYIESITLRDYLLNKRFGGYGGYIPWDKARSLFMPVLSTLGMLHTAGIIHRGISPITLHIGRDSKMRLGGFSIWQARTARGDLTAQLFPGYAAIEQYGFEGQQGPWTDIYAFTATLYRALIGTDPIEATERLTNDKLMVPGKFAEQLPAYVINGLINGLQILPEDRTRSVEQLRAELSASPAATAASGDFTGSVQTPAPKPGTPERKPAEKRAAPEKKQKQKSPINANKLLIFKTALISAIVCLVIFLVVVLLYGDRIGLANEETTTQATTGAEMIEVSNFVNRSYSEVTTNAYWTSNYSFEKVEVYHDTIPEGYIIEQSVEVGTQVNKGAVITLTVSKGVEQFELPNVVGFSYDDAKSLLKEKNFIVSKETKENDGSHDEGNVQSIRNLTAGKMYDKGTAVTLIVWGKAPTTEPPATQTQPIEEPTSESNSNLEEPSSSGVLNPVIPPASEQGE